PATPRIDMPPNDSLPPNDSGDSTGAFCPLRATHPARDRINESTAFCESERGIRRPGERHGLVAMPSREVLPALSENPHVYWCLRLRQKTPAYTSSPFFSPPRTTLKEVLPKRSPL